MHIHILGVCGTFMAGIAKIAKSLGHTVTGSDLNVYPPMSDVLQAEGITIQSGYLPEHIDASVDCVIIGNAISRGNPCVEFILNQKIPFISGPQWLSENVLKHKHVLAVSGTHGKTTTTALLAWILETAGLKPGFLIGGSPKNFNETARISESDFFVIEADEYDTAFFDKRSKFLHYYPRTLIMNNLEYDHADIFPDLNAIQTQFQYLLRCVPSDGTVIFPQADSALQTVVSRGCWSKKITMGDKGNWHINALHPSFSQFEINHANQQSMIISWNLVGEHNAKNALATAVAAHSIGISTSVIEKAISTFAGVKRRLEIRGRIHDVTIYDDFAHHPTAIQTTIAGLRAKVGSERIIVIAQLGSNTMEMGMHQQSLAHAFQQADQVHVWHADHAKWSIEPVLQALGKQAFSYKTVADIIDQVVPTLKPKDHVLMMSNKSFDGIHEKFISRLQNKEF